MKSHSIKLYNKTNMKTIKLKHWVIETKSRIATERTERLIDAFIKKLKEQSGSKKD
jgi:hypothetical protein